MDRNNPTLTELKPYFEDIKVSDSKEIGYYEHQLPKHIKNPDRWVWSWNWSAALFKGLWLIYRKMYWQGALFFGCKIFLYQFIESAYYLYPHTPYKFIAHTFFLLTFGGFGNALYYRDLKNRANKKSARKGVNGWFLLALILISVILAFAIGVPKLEELLSN